mgnify:CR=1 FL=1
MTKKLLNRRTSRGSRQIFDLRKLYLSEIVPTSEYNNFFDSSVTRFYGKVDLEANIIYPSEKFLVTLPNPNKKAPQTYYALNFVAKAFSDFREYYLKGINTGIVKQSPDALEIIEPVQGWESMHQLYASNIDDLYSVLVNNYLQRPRSSTGLENSYPKDFDHFMKSINHLLKSRGGAMKLSRSSFILSIRCPISTSGLAIEIGPNIDYANDKKKAKNLYENPNFDFYMNTLSKFGFMADVDYPGRIVADLASPAMQSYMEEFELTLDNLFETYYYKAGEYDYDLIRIYLSQFYNSYVTDYPIKSIVKKSGAIPSHKYSIQASNYRTSDKPIPTAGLKIICEKTTREIIQRQKLSEHDKETKYTDSYWLTTYAQMLNYELKNPLEQHNLNKVIKNSQDLKKNVDIEAATSYINGVFKMFRYPVNIISHKSTPNVQQSSATTTTTETTTSTATTTSGGSSGGY